MSVFIQVTDTSACSDNCKLLLTRQSYLTLALYMPGSNLLKILAPKVIYRLQKPTFSKINDNITARSLKYLQKVMV